MLIPSYLKNTAKEVNINDFLNVEIVTTSNEETFDILYCGTLEEIEGDQLITKEDSEIPLKIIAKSTLSGKEILLYDGAYYGYDSMFCDEFEEDATQNRELQKYPINNLSNIRLSIGIGIDYESEKEDYEFDENGNVILIDERHIPWEQVKTDGFDFLEIAATDENGSSLLILTEELA
ncbi:hypothetical protein AB349_06050 [Listeria monocytogenes]|uniref:Uncharacterized protein n=1 Tax=Listeria monocytogenes serotype 4a (strain M7) TaxID=1030009 RepID=A0A0E0UUW6_LISMM|nr:hypothetical protein [Listeria monocytogenes]ACK39872.1 conserved hypothetical protein [Listeria monocytogenes HCC23]AEH92134.1 hypothetical protein LMM7_1129 [Listeria monocytogenes M7]AKS53703.1 hypothetical protein LM850658_05490 [Listeria monocytogenes]EAC6862018.1 hypothetical protein [Listeria monocytogenes]EAD0180799.1 hypothetical protein [Listeria monocytogenes]